MYCAVVCLHFVFKQYNQTRDTRGAHGSVISCETLQWGEESGNAQFIVPHVFVVYTITYMVRIVKTLVEIEWKRVLKLVFAASCKLEWDTIKAMKVYALYV